MNAETLKLKNNKTAEREWKKAQEIADQKNRPTSGWTTSSSINWNGFSKHLTYTKTIDNETLHFTVSQRKDIEITLVSFQGQKYFMRKSVLVKLEKMWREKNLIKKTFGSYRMVYWHS